MAKFILYIRANGSVDLSGVQADVLSGLMGTGIGNTEETALKNITRAISVDGREYAEVQPFYLACVHGGLSETEAYNAIANAFKPKPSLFNSSPVVSFAIVDGANVPDKTYRNAWVAVNNQVVVDMPKARAIHLERLKAQREELLKVLDVEWSKHTAQNKKQEADAIEAKRQALRDMPVTIQVALNAAQTPEQLKLVTSPALNI